jgi:Mn2+/Fe2+ NRAMP family transporter
VVSIFIIATAAATGGTGPLSDVGQAAAALRPVAGQAASQLFAIGLLGAALLAATVVPLSTAYAIAETAGVERSLSRKLREAPFFYGSTPSSWLSAPRSHFCRGTRSTW